MGRTNLFAVVFDGMDFTTTEDVTGLGDLDVPKNSPSSGASGPTSSPKLIIWFPSTSVDPDRKRSIIISILEDARVLFAPIGVASYLRCLVTEEDQAKMNEVLVLHHETFLRYRDELNQLEAEVRGFTEKRDTYKLLNEQHEEEAKGLRAELEAARKEHADLVEQVKIFEVSDDEIDTVTNGRNLQVQQKIDRIDQFRAEIDAVKVEAEEWRGRMDRLALEKENAQAQLASAEAQLQAAEEEKDDARSQRVEELQSQLSSVVFDRETIAKELKVAKSVVEETKADVDEMVAQYKADGEAAQAFEEVHARSFDLSAEDESAKGFEAEAKKLAYPKDEEDSEGSDESRGGEDSDGDGDGDEAGSSGDQAVYVPCIFFFVF
uniref:Myosin heavy chain, embryonic smooth muscle isoform-like n=1 Tax=Nicotiana tabacum TaxID=4097 RepID=A0A1S3ZAU6_TOBAC